MISSDRLNHTSRFELSSFCRMSHTALASLYLYVVFIVHAEGSFCLDTLFCVTSVHAVDRESFNIGPT